MSSSFYNSLQVIKDFSEVGNPAYFKQAPDDWWILITDVKGSTRAIQKGHYKEVNQIGVAVIAAVKNILGDDVFLYVFGGDGATLVLSKEQYQKVYDKLNGLVRLAEKKFNLILRVGAVQVSEVTHPDHKLKIALLKINAHQNLAVFLGGGLTEAERIIRIRDSQKKESPPNNDLELEGLSCRWRPLDSNKGNIISLLVLSRDANDSSRIYTLVVTELNKILGGNIENANPVNILNAKYKGFFRLFFDEAKLYNKVPSVSYLRRCFEIAICVFCFKFGIPLFQKSPYVSAIPGHCDYKKVDDVLRMVLDTTDKQVDEIRSFLSKLHDKEQIYFGVHRSPQALMTCLVEGLADGEHIHFIDGSDGGYAMAAAQLKSQIKNRIC